MTEAVPNLHLAQLLFQARSAPSDTASKAQRELHDAIVAGDLACLYDHLTPPHSPHHQPELSAKMAARNAEKVTQLRRDITDAESSEDDARVIDAWLALGNFYAQHCDLPNATTTLRHAAEKTAAVGSQIDIALTLARMGFLYGERALVARELDRAEQLLARGGDWERRNKYKTYRGLYCLSIRQFSEAAALLIDSFATFTCTELLAYEDVVAFGVVCGALVLDRVGLKKKIVDSPEVLALQSQNHRLEPLCVLTNSLYTGEYAAFLRALADVETLVLRASPFLVEHAAFYVREMRCRAYAQLLESYLALNLRSMAKTFGVSVAYLETDLARLIPQKKLNCVVDKVNGVVVTNRPDMKNAQYQQLIKQGDALLTKLQKYGAAVRLYGADSQS